MAVLPLAKLLALAMKQVSKPVANQLKHTAKSNPFLRKYVCAPPAQILHRLEVFVKFRLMGGTGKVEYTPLKEERAVEIGSEMIGEMVVYGIAAGVLFYELWNSRKLAEEKEQALNDHLTNLNKLITNQECELILVKSRLEKLESPRKIVTEKDKKPVKTTTTR